MSLAGSNPALPVRHGTTGVLEGCTGSPVEGRWHTLGEISVFNFVSIDGFFAGPNGEIDWFKTDQDDEFARFTQKQAGSADSGGGLIYGRTTYEMMKSYWPTSEAIKAEPAMAEVVNNRPKIVFSRTLQRVEEGPHWKNIRLFHEIKPETIVKLKEQSGPGLTILGSGTIVQQFANLGLIDEYALVVIPSVLGAGKRLFQGVNRLNLKLLGARAFKNGVVVLNYRAA